MQITVEISEVTITNLVRDRLAELFSDDSRYRATMVRDALRRIVDDAALIAVKNARDAIADKLPELASVAVERAIKNDIEKAAKRGIDALRKLFAGFDPNKLTLEQRLWLENQIKKAAQTESNSPA